MRLSVLHDDQMRLKHRVGSPRGPTAVQQTVDFYMRGACGPPRGGPNCPHLGRSRETRRFVTVPELQDVNDSQGGRGAVPSVPREMVSRSGATGDEPQPGDRV